MSDLEDIVDALDRPVWGAAAIGKVIGRSESETFYLLSQNVLDANKVGKKNWMSTPRRLLRSLQEGNRAS
jgi:hypothetical protein